ncbi:MAG: hypothetical protein QOE41_2966, partial [Mycobacterium sp.]|nr:hypothetical protein [Mycobacterium sp.]
MRTHRRDTPPRACHSVILSRMIVGGVAAAGKLSNVFDAIDFRWPAAR